MNQYTDEHVRQAIAYANKWAPKITDVIESLLAERTRLQAEIDAFHRLLPIWREREMQAYNKHDEYYDGKSHGIEICADHLEEVIASQAIDSARARKGDV